MHGPLQPSTSACSVVASNIFNGLCNSMRQSSYSTILNGVYNQIVGPETPSSTTFIDDANPYSNAILNGSYASINGSGITVINDGRYRGGGEGLTNRANYNISHTIYLDATSGVNIVTGNLKFGNQSLIKFNNNSGTLFADSTKESSNSFSGPKTLTLDFESGIFIKNKTILQNSYIPSTSTSPGTSGQIATDSNYFYSYDGSKWKRTALAEW